MATVLGHNKLSQPGYHHIGQKGLLVGGALNIYCFLKRGWLRGLIFLGL